MIEELNAELSRERQLRADVEARLSASGATVEKAKAIAIVERDQARRMDTPLKSGEPPAEVSEAQVAAQSRHSQAFDALRRARPKTKPRRKSRKKR